MSDYNGTYTLVATWKGQRRTSRIYGNPYGGVDALAGAGASLQDKADTDATMGAIARIMNKAVDSEIWARGEIRLIQGRREIHRMEAKG